MAKRIVYSLRAQSDRKEILAYWIQRNQSKTYSKKLFLLFKEAAKLVAKHPEIGRETQFQNIRIKVVRDYLIVYEVQADRIEILTFFDCRRNPAEMKRIMKK